MPQAARLVRLSTSGVASIVGPEPDDTTLPRKSPIAVAELDLGFDENIITFHGLIEIWVAAQLHEEGIPWPTIRFASFQARRVLKTRHPFTYGSFRTDGRRVFLSLKGTRNNPKIAVDLLSRQQVFEDIIERSLRGTIVVRGADGRI